MPGRRQRGEGSLFRRSRDGRWVAVADLGWRDGKRDRRLFTAATPEEAIERRAAFLAARRDGFTSPKGRPPYVGEWVRHWCDHIARPRVEATTWDRSYRQKCEQLIIPFFARHRLPELAEEDIEAWHAHLRRKVSARTGRPLSPSTIGQAHRILSSALKAAVVRGKMPRNPCSNVTPPRVTRPEPQPPTAAERDAIMAACQEWPNGARWVLAITTGIRQGEALALRWSDVDLAAPSVTVSRTAARTAGGALSYKAPKSEKSRRTITLAPQAMAALREHRARSIRDLRNDLVFTRGGEPWHPRADYSDWHALLDSLGIRHYRVHDLRHGYATMLLEQGVDVRVAQEQMGHSTPDFTRRAYQHVGPKLRKDAADAVSRALRGE